MGNERILIVEDDAQLRDLVALTVRRLGGCADPVGDGLGAVEMLQERRYAVVILDLMMPLLNGYDVVAALRDFRRRPAVIVITALNGHRHRELDPAIVTAVVRKPFDVELLAAIAVETAQSFQRAAEKGDPLARQRRAAVGSDALVLDAI